MSDCASSGDPLARLADEFVDRHRRGERPALTDYAARHPELAERIRELFPALVMLEDVRPGPPAGGAAAAVGPPRRLGEYRLVREVGRGGMGVVYEAEQESLGRRVALKVLPPGVAADPRLVQRFQREARAAARLHHTGIVPVFAVGEEAGTHFYVMQYIEGCSLAAVLEELRRGRGTGTVLESAPEGGPSPDAAGPLSAQVAQSLLAGRFRPPAGQPSPEPSDPTDSTRHDSTGGTPPRPPAPPEPTPPRANPPSGGGAGGSLTDPRRPYAHAVAHLGAQVADALEYAAGQGILHRDVKPSNLLLDVWGAVWLTDFGLAKATGAEDLTGPGDLLGTLRYMAPERFRGRADARSDVYSLGLTLYEMLVLRPAFEAGGQGELMQQITGAGPPPLGRAAPGLRRDLVTVVHKASARDPADRYQSAGALAEDLRRFLDGRPIRARRVGLVEQGWRWCRRNPTGAALVVALLALLVLAAGGGVWLEWQKAERRADAAQRQELARQAVETALERADPRRAAGRWPEAKAVLAQAEGRLDEANSDELRQRLKQARTDLELGTRLEGIRMDRAASVAGDFAGPRAAGDYATAFAEAGLALAGEETAERIRRSAIREQLVAALDDWGLATSNGILRWQLAHLASQVDPDPRWRDRLPGILVWNERAALERLAAEAPVDKLSPQFLNLLGVRLRQSGADPERFLRRAQQFYPTDFWLNYDLGLALLGKSQPAEAAGFFRAALVARPDSSHVYNKLGMALIKQGRPEEAVAAYRRAVDLDSKNSNAHYNLAEAYYEQGRTGQAVAEYRRAIEARPPDAMHSHNKLGLILEARGQIQEAMTEYRRGIARDPGAYPPHFNLGRLLAAQGQTEEAMKELRRAIALDPEEDGAHFHLGRCLQSKGQWEQAMAEYRRAIELDPKSGRAHYHLGAALQAKGRADEAVAEFRTTVQVDPTGALGHDALAAALLRQGRFAEARAAARRALDRFPADEPLRPSMRQTLEQAERMLALEARLPALLEGKARPADAAELLEQARLFRDHGRPHAAARLYAAAFAARPALADDLGSRNRYDAACVAARAADSPAGDGARLGEPDRVALRRQALDWLRADLTLRAGRRPGSQSAGEALKTWQTDDALSGVRDEAALEKLPADERERWRRLWADLDVALADDPLEQGRAHAARGEWGRAAECYARALEGSPTDDGHFWFEYAAVLLLSRDRPGYAKACGHMVRHHRKVPLQVLRSYHVARACTLAPDSVADLAGVRALADKELQDDRGLFWSLTEQGALCYRAGEFQNAATLLERSLRADAMPGRAVLNWLWLALANQRLGKGEEACRWLGKAQAWLDQYRGGMPARADAELGLHLHNWLEAQVLRREAEALLALRAEESVPADAPKK
jgi:serine/threonine protein kinase/Flp pilus assembly protein TadD